MSDIEPYLKSVKVFEDSCNTFHEALEVLKNEYQIYYQLYEKKKYTIEKQDIEDFGNNIKTLSIHLDRCNVIIDEVYQCLYEPIIDENKLYALVSELIEKTNNLSEESLNTKEIITKLRANSSIVESRILH